MNELRSVLLLNHDIATLRNFSLVVSVTMAALVTHRSNLHGSATTSIGAVNGVENVSRVVSQLHVGTFLRITAPLLLIVFLESNVKPCFLKHLLFPYLKICCSCQHRFPSPQKLHVRPFAQQNPPRLLLFKTQQALYLVNRRVLVCLLNHIREQALYANPEPRNNPRIFLSERVVLYHCVRPLDDLVPSDFLHRQCELLHPLPVTASVDEDETVRFYLIIHKFIYFPCQHLNTTNNIANNFNKFMHLQCLGVWDSLSSFRPRTSSISG